MYDGVLKLSRAFCLQCGESIVGCLVLVPILIELFLEFFDEASALTLLLAHLFEFLQRLRVYHLKLFEISLESANSSCSFGELFPGCLKLVDGLIHLASDRLSLLHQ